MLLGFEFKTSGDVKGTGVGPFFPTVELLDAGLIFAGLWSCRHIRHFPIEWNT